jgi:3-phosphoshikimate 1-carboxyvinyltransferase
MSRRTVTPSSAPLNADLSVPASKSVTHRALVAAALANGESTVHNPLVATDTLVTLEGLIALGVHCVEREGQWNVRGLGGVVPGSADLSLRDSGTSFRFLLALAALSASPSRLDGSPRLRQRPVAELAQALGGLGARVRLAPRSEGLPLEAGGSVPAGGSVRIPSGRSSQFASALLLVGSALPHGLDLILEPPVVSLPYVELTAQVLRRFGARVERREQLHWRVDAGTYPGRDYRVEGDHSTASYFLAAAAIAGGRVRVRDVDPESRQPDRRMGEILEKLGCSVERGADWVEATGSRTIPAFDLSMADAPDLVPTLAALALFADGPCVVRDVAHLRLKESDRLELLAQNLTTLGRLSKAVDDRLEVGPPGTDLRGALIATASDHRIAMAFAIAGLRVEGITLDDADCVAKSDPGFWHRFEELTC